MSNNIPVFVERDPAVIMAESKAMIEELLGREVQPAQVEQLILNCFVYREVLINNRFNSGMSQMLYQFSTAPVLDYIAALVAVERLPAATAGCTVRFTLVDGHGSVLIPAGTRVATTDGQVIFETLDDVSLSATDKTANIQVQAQIAGTASNGYAPGTVNKILDPLAFVSTVTNLDETGGGSDVETDEQLRARIKLAPSQFSSAGSRQSYEFYAKSANALITDVSVTSPVPGTVLIVALTATGDTPEQVINDIYDTCNAENVRPLTDTVVVAAPTPQAYSIEVNIQLYEDTDATTTKTAVSGLLNDYANDKGRKLGLDIIRSHIAQICRLDNVYDVEVVAPADNIVVTEGQYARCNGVTVNITGFNRG